STWTKLVEAERAKRLGKIDKESEAVETQAKLDEQASKALAASPPVGPWRVGIYMPGSVCRAEKRMMLRTPSLAAAVAILAASSADARPPPPPPDAQRIVISVTV